MSVSIPAERVETDASALAARIRELAKESLRDGRNPFLEHFRQAFGEAIPDAASTSTESFNRRFNRSPLMPAATPLGQAWHNLRRRGGDLHLEVGAGALDDGQRQELLKLYGARQIVAFDLDPEFRPRAAGDCHRLPFRDGTFDSAGLRALLEHVRRPWDVVREVHRVLRPGGYLAIGIPFLWKEHHRPHDYWRMSRECVDGLLADAGFRVRHVQKGEPGFFTVMSMLTRTAIPGRKTEADRAVQLIAAVLHELKVLDPELDGASDFYGTVHALAIKGEAEEPGGHTLDEGNAE